MDPHKQDQPQDINYQQDIHNKDVRDIIAEANEWEDDQWGEAQKQPQEPAKIEEKPKEEAKPQEQSTNNPQEKVVTPPVEPVKPQEPVKPVDEEKLTDTMVQKLYDKLNPQTPEEKKDFATKLKELNEKAKSENREPTYEEALQLLGEETKEKTKSELKQELKKEIMEDLNKEVDEEQKKQQEAAKQAQEIKDKSQKALYSEWDRQLGMLIQQKHIPQVVNKDDPNDPGMVVQKNLFEAVNQIAKRQQEAGQKVSLSLVEAFMSPEYKAIVDQAGKNAPVNGARKSVGSNGSPALNYMQDIHNKSLEDIIKESYVEAEQAQ